MKFSKKDLAKLAIMANINLGSKEKSVPIIFHKSEDPCKVVAFTTIYSLPFVQMQTTLDNPLEKTFCVTDLSKFLNILNSLDISTLGVDILENDKNIKTLLLKDERTTINGFPTGNENMAYFLANAKPEVNQQLHERSKTGLLPIDLNNAPSFIINHNEFSSIISTNFKVNNFEADNPPVSMILNFKSENEVVLKIGYDENNLKKRGNNPPVLVKTLVKLEESSKDISTDLNYIIPLKYLETISKNHTVLKFYLEDQKAIIHSLEKGEEVNDFEYRLAYHTTKN